MLYSDIREDFVKIKSQKKFLTEHILEKLAKKYRRSAKTIENIVFNRV